eukprot:2989137-Pyramimonas_sp.AAC.1
MSGIGTRAHKCDQLLNGCCCWHGARRSVGALSRTDPGRPLPLPALHFAAASSCPQPAGAAPTPVTGASAS